jgi:superfamily I DNA/RNA helicase
MLSEYLNSNYGHYGFKILTFDKLCTESIRFNDTYEKTRLDFLEYLLEDNNLFEYTDIIVDEGQDFENDWLEYLAEKIPEDGCFYVFYDQQQCLYFEDVNKWIKQAPCKITLFINCRNTEAIAKTAYGTLGINKKQPTLSGIEGEQPELISFENAKDFSSWMDKEVNNYIIETKVDKNSVALITMNTFENSIIPEVIKFSKLSFSESKEKGFICISTARKFKGLEADLVIITDLDWNKLNNEIYRKLFYTTCSRAKHNLFINSNKLIDENVDSILQNLQGENRRKRRGKRRFLQLLNLKENESIRHQ